MIPFFIQCKHFQRSRVYTHTYDRPNLDAVGIPDGTTTAVTEEHTENHFDLTPLCAAYQDYESNFNARTWPQRDAYWAKLIGKLQRFLPVHVLQRYCDPDMPFYPLPKFNNAFKRSMDFYNWVTSAESSLFGSTLSSDFALWRCGVHRAQTIAGVGALPRADSAAVSQLDEVSTNEMEKIIQQLSAAAACCWASSLSLRVSIRQCAMDELISSRHTAKYQFSNSRYCHVSLVLTHQVTQFER